MADPAFPRGIAQIVSIPGGAAGTEATVKYMVQLAVSDAKEPEMVQYARRIVSDVPSKDYVGEARAIFEFVRSNVRYRLDPRGLEWIQRPFVTLLVDGAGDCFTKGTRVLRREGHALVPIESLRIGDEIWGWRNWTRVTQTWDRGVRKTWLVRLNNGSTMRLTPEHKIWRAVCRHHAAGSARNQAHTCPLDQREIVCIPLSEAREGDVLLAPDKIDWGTEAMDPRRAYVEGLYLSDGSSDKKKHSFEIAGRDGFPREDQKKEVASICSELGIETKTFYNCISVKDGEWADNLRKSGTLAWEKKAVSINLNESAGREYLRGILADSGRNTHGAGRTFTTSSREFWLQTRVLLKSLGVTCSERFIQDHGSTSKYPIWRLGIRESEALDGLGVIRDKAWRKTPAAKARSNGNPKPLRVLEIIKDDMERDCCDIETADHYVWLPEADWTVKNCDDQSMLVACLALCLGHGAAFKTVKVDPDRPEEYSHVYPLIGVRDKRNKPIWLAADTTQKGVELGWEPPPERVLGSKTWILAEP
jgi:hypothetical protein